jgi:hypothetical protein
MSDDGKDNVVHLGTGDLVAIGKALRDMYDFYLRSKPSEQLERLVEKIGEAGSDPTAQREAKRAGLDDAAPRGDGPPP